MKYCKEQEDVVTCLVGCLSSKFRHTQDRSFLKSIEGKTDFPSLDGKKMFRLLDKGELFFILVKPYKERIEELLVASVLRWSNYPAQRYYKIHMAKALLTFILCFIHFVPPEIIKNISVFLLFCYL